MDNEKKSYVIQKLEYLLKELQHLYEEDLLKSEFLFAPDYIDVGEILYRVQKNNAIDKNTLKELNYIYRKTLAQQQCIKDHNRIMEYDEWLEWNIKDILRNKTIKNAIEYHQANAINKDGNFYTLSESKNIVEQIKLKMR